MQMVLHPQFCWVETKRTVPWIKPEDLLFTVPEDATGAEPFDGLGLKLLMVDGSVRSLAAPIDWTRLGQQITRAGARSNDGHESYTTTSKLNVC